jgi:hypothetical protein
MLWRRGALGLASRSAPLNSSTQPRLIEIIGKEDMEGDVGGELHSRHEEAPIATNRSG